MKAANARALRILAMSAALAAAGCGGAVRGPGPEEAALEAFRRGDFDKAEALLRDSMDPVAMRILARIHLIHNRPREAAALIEQVVRADPRDMSAYHELASAYMRAGDFRGASRWYAVIGDQLMARKCEALARLVGYVVDGPAEETRIPYAAADPVPAVPVSVNGLPGVFAVDTGTGEVILKREFAARARVGVYGIRTAAYEKGFDEAVIEEITLGPIRVRGVPARLGSPPPAPGLRLDGSIGLALLMQFDFTLDDRRGRLALRRPGGPPAGIPAILAGEAHLLARGKLNGSLETFAALASGLPGVEAAAPAALLPAVGGEIREIEVGPLRLARPRIDTRLFPPGLETAYGFTVGLVLGREALKGRSMGLDPRSMRLRLE